MKERMLKSYSPPILQVVFLIIVIFQYYVNIGLSEQYTTILALEMMAIYAWILTKSLKRWGLFDIYSLLLCTVGLFTYGEIVFSFFDTDVDFRIASIGEVLTFNENTIQKAMLIYSAFMLSLDFGMNCFRKDKEETVENIVTFNRDIYNVGKNLLVLFAVFAFYRAFVQYQLLNANRLLLFKGGSEGLDLPLYLRITSTFFLIGYYIFTASKPPMKQFLWVTVVYILIQIPDLMVGNRMALGVLFLYVIWMMVSVYGYKVNTKKLVIPIIALVLVFQYIGMSRVGMETSGISTISFLINFLTMQATSFGLLCSYIQYTPYISGPYPFVLDSLIGGLTGYSGQSEATLAHRASIGHQLVYEISPNYYFSGQSSGTCFVTELYEFGIVSVIIGSILFAYMIYFYQKNFSHSRGLLLFSYIVFTVFVTSPRAGMFVPLYQIIRTLAFVWIAFKVNKFVTGKSVNVLSWFKGLKL